MQPFANNFITKSAGDISDFGIKLIDDNNMETESADGKKKFPHRKLFDWIFSINRINRKKSKKQRGTYWRCASRTQKILCQTFKSQYKKR